MVYGGGAAQQAGGSPIQQAIAARRQQDEMARQAARSAEVDERQLAQQREMGREQISLQERELQQRGQLEQQRIDAQAAAREMEEEQQQWMRQEADTARKHDKAMAAMQVEGEKKMMEARDGLERARMADEREYAEQMQKRVTEAENFNRLIQEIQGGLQAKKTAGLMREINQLGADADRVVERAREMGSQFDTQRSQYTDFREDTRRTLENYLGNVGPADVDILKERGRSEHPGGVGVVNQTVNDLVSRNTEGQLSMADLTDDHGNPDLRIIGAYIEEGRIGTGQLLSLYATLEEAQQYLEQRAGDIKVPDDKRGWWARARGELTEEQRMAYLKENMQNQARTLDQVRQRLGQRIRSVSDGKYKPVWNVIADNSPMGPEEARRKAWQRMAERPMEALLVNDADIREYVINKMEQIPEHFRQREDFGPILEQIKFSLQTRAQQWNEFLTAQGLTEDVEALRAGAEDVWGRHHEIPAPSQLEE